MINIQENVLLSEYTTFRIGWPARYFVEVSTEEELIEASSFAKEKSLEFFVMGGGSNLLVSDTGFNGVVIKMKLNGFKVDINSKTIMAESGAPLAKLVSDSIENGLTGMEWASGIPGTVGGAIRGNARAFGKNTGMAIESVKAFNVNEMKVSVYENEECKFKYFGSMFKTSPNLIILSATIKLKKGNKGESKKESIDIIKKRISMQPRESSPGSFFLNPIVANEKLRADFEEEKGMKPKDEKLPAGWVIDKAGLLGKKMGGAMISEMHGNFIINTGAATAEDVIMLVSFVKYQVRDKFGVQLQEEVQYLGF